MEDKGQYKFNKLTKEDCDYLKESHDEALLGSGRTHAFEEPIHLSTTNTTMETEEQKPAEKPLSEVEKAKADVDRYEAKLAEQERELEKTKFYLTICKRSLKAHLKAEEKFKK